MRGDRSSPGLAGPVEAVCTQGTKERPALRSRLPHSAVDCEIDGWLDLRLRMVATLIPIELG